MTARRRSYVAKWPATVGATVRVGDASYRVRYDGNALTVEPANDELLAELAAAIDEHSFSHGDDLRLALERGGFDFADLEVVTRRQRVEVGTVFSPAEGAVDNEEEARKAEILRTLREGEIVSVEPVVRRRGK